MRKIVTAMFGIVATLVTILPAEAQHYRRHNAPQHRAHPAPRYYAPQRYARPQRNWVPYAVGAGIIGALVGTYFYNQYGQICQNIAVGQGWNGYRYVPVTETVCE
jgi:hypothetical protein